MRLPASSKHLARQSAATARGHRRWASAAVEFAVVAIPFFILVLGLIEVGRAFMVQHLLLAAARRSGAASVELAFAAPKLTY